MAKRIIPCLDVKDGKVVKGVRFVDLKIEGDPAKLAAIYEEQGADELVFLDIEASHEGRGTMLDVVKRTAEMITVPLTVGGGIRSIADIESVLSAGADKVSINTAAVSEPSLIRKAAETFGSRSIVVAIDAKRVYVEKAVPDKTIVETVEGRCWWEVYVKGGRAQTGMDSISWANRVKELGAGELLPTSIDYDGTQNGYDVQLTRAMSEATNLSVIASGGAGNLEHIYEVLTEGKADAALAASIFHRAQYTVREVKEHLARRGVPVRHV